MDQRPHDHGAPRLTTIVITGGPCSGKTSAMERLKRELDLPGAPLLFVPEVATELIGGGVAPWTCRSYDHFQRAVFEMQLSKEEAFANAARQMDARSVVMVLDRGVMDNQAYMTEAGFRRLLAERGTDLPALYARYDAVFHLVSTARGLPGAYTLDNNLTRKETPEQAAAVDERLVAAWSGHPRLRVIDNAPSFEGKLAELLREVRAFLADA